MTKTISFKEIPIWTGIQKQPGIKALDSFTIEWDKRGYIYQNTQNRSKNLNEIYSSNEYSFITDPPGTSNWANRLGKENIDFVVNNYNSLEGKSILEIGAGSLYIAKQFVYEYGVAHYQVVDPAVREISDDTRINVLRDYFDKRFSKTNKYDLIISFNCLEHVPDPIEFLENIRSLLNSDGKAILVFPDVEQEFINGDFNVLLHEHISYFSYRMASDILSRYGFNIIEGQSHAGSLRFVVEVKQNANPYLPENNNLKSLFDLSAVTFRKSIIEANRVVREALKHGEIIAFHGATNGLNNALFLIGLSDCNQFLLYDGDENKSGKYLPACVNRITHSKDDSYKSANKVFISTTTFFDEIKQFIINEHGLSPEIIIPLFSTNLEL